MLAHPSDTSLKYWIYFLIQSRKSYLGNAGKKFVVEYLLAFQAEILWPVIEILDNKPDYVLTHSS